MLTLTALPVKVLEVEKRQGMYEQIVTVFKNILPETWQHNPTWIERKGYYAKSVEFSNKHYHLTLEDTPNAFIVNLEVRQDNKFVKMANGDFKRVCNNIKNRVETLAKHV